MSTTTRGSIQEKDWSFAVNKTGNDIVLYATQNMQMVMVGLKCDQFRSPFGMLSEFKAHYNRDMRKSGRKKMTPEQYRDALSALMEALGPCVAR